MFDGAVSNGAVSNGLTRLRCVLIRASESCHDSLKCNCKAPAHRLDVIDIAPSRSHSSSWQTRWLSALCVRRPQLVRVCPCNTQCRGMHMQWHRDVAGLSLCTPADIDADLSTRGGSAWARVEIPLRTSGFFATANARELSATCRRAQRSNYVRTDERGSACPERLFSSEVCCVEHASASGPLFPMEHACLRMSCACPVPAVGSIVARPPLWRAQPTLLLLSAAGEDRPEQ